MNQNELLQAVTDWKTKHTNPYNNGIEETVYWQVHDIFIMLQTPNLSKNVVQLCEKCFLRFRYIYIM